METYPRAAVERAMKVQEVLMRAMAKKITRTQAGEIIGLCDRQMRCWKERYIEFGYDGLFDHRLGKPSPKRLIRRLTQRWSVTLARKLPSERASARNVRQELANVGSRSVAGNALRDAEASVKN